MADQCVHRPQAAREGRGMAWVAGAFVICPCHLPITLAKDLDEDIRIDKDAAHFQIRFSRSPFRRRLT